MPSETLFNTVTLLKEEQPLKALLPTDNSVEGKVMEVKAVQPLKVDVPRYSTDDGMVTD